MAATIKLESGAEIKNFKTRTYAFLLYPDTNDKHKTALVLLRQGYNYLAIQHTEDTTEEGMPKGAHFHCIVKFRQPRWLSAVSEELGVEPNLFRDCKSFDGYARYMLHLDNPEKAQYDFEALEGTLRDLAEKACIGEETESERVLRLLELLDAERRVLTMRQFVGIVCKAGLYADCRRAGYLMSRMLEEHNQEVQMSVDFSY